MKISVEVSATFTSQLISNHTKKMIQVPTEVNENLHFSLNWDGKTSWNFTHSFKCQTVGISNHKVSINQHHSNLNLHLHQNLGVIFLPKISWSTDHCNWPKVGQCIMTVYILSLTIRLWPRCCKYLDPLQNRGKLKLSMKWPVHW